MRKKLKDRLLAQEAMEVFNSYDIVGDIAIIKTPREDIDSAKKAAEAILKLYPHKVKTVLLQTGAVQGDFRVRELKFLAGEEKSITFHKESGCSFKVDVKNCYYSPRLLFEHQRVANLVLPKEVVINMFAGIGCFSVFIGQKVESAKVYSIDINSAAYDCMKDNVKINKVENQVIPLLGDSKYIIASRLCGIADRVLMPLPELALEYLPYALKALKAKGGWIYYYDFEHAMKTEDPLEKSKIKVKEKLNYMGINFEIAYSRIIRSTGPNWYQTVLDIYVANLPDKF